MPVGVIVITNQDQDWPTSLAAAVKQADDHTIIAVDTSEKAAVAHAAAARLGKTVRVEVHSDFI